MTVRQFVRSVNRISKAIERDQRRRQRELAAQLKESKSLQEQQAAELAVMIFENQLEVLGSVHHEVADSIDWAALAKHPKPAQPQRLSSEEDSATNDLQDFRPTVWERLFKAGGKHRRESLQDAIELGRGADDITHQRRLAEHSTRIREWESSVKLASLVLNRDSRAMVQAIEEIDPFSEISIHGRGLKFHFDDRNTNVIFVQVDLAASDVVPSEEKSLTSRGKLSTKAMPKSRFWAIYQDYVCGASLRIAREVFALLPVEFAIVTARSELLNSSTGHLAETPILSMLASRQTFEQLNFEQVDPSDALANFVHRMNYLKTQGFRPVEALGLADIPRR